MLEALWGQMPLPISAVSAGANFPMCRLTRQIRY